MAQKCLICMVAIMLVLSFAMAENKPNQDAESDEYFRLYSSAIHSSDSKFIMSVINKIDNEYIHNSKLVNGLYYNKAQLLLKIKHYDEAVEAMKQDKSKNGELYLATLLMRIGKTKDSTELFNKLSNELYAALHNNITENEKKAIVENIFILGIFLNDNTSALAKDIVDKRILQRSTVDEIVVKTSIPKDELLRNMWPE